MGGSPAGRTGCATQGRGGGVGAMGEDSQAEGVLHSHVLVVGRVGRGVVEREIHLHNTWLCQPPACAPALTADKDWDPGNTFCPNLFLCPACGITPQVMLQALPGAELRVLAGGLTSPWETVPDPVLDPDPEPAVLQEMQRWVVVPSVSNQASPGIPSTADPSRKDALFFGGASSSDTRKPMVPGLGRTRALKWDDGFLFPPLPGYASSLLPAPLPSVTAPTSQGTFSSGTGKRRV